MAGKQARVLSKPQQRAVLAYLDGNSRYPERDKAAFLLSVRAGLRAMEIAGCRWAWVMTPDREIGDDLVVPDDAAKWGGGRSVPVSADLKAALAACLDAQREWCARRRKPWTPNLPVVMSERGIPFTAPSMVNHFHRLYGALNLLGCSSHSGRRTFITGAARAIVECGGSIRDVQDMAGHKHLNTTQRYIDTNAEAKRRVVDRI